MSNTDQNTNSNVLIEEYTDLLYAEKLSKERIKNILEIVYIRGESAGIARARKIIEDA